MTQKLKMLAALVMLTGCQPVATNSEVMPHLGAAVMCDFQQHECQQQGNRLTLLPATAPSETPLSLQLQLAPGQTIVAAQITGRDMYMGMIPVKFDQHGSAQTMVGSCATDHMVWRLAVRLQDQGGKLQTLHFDWLADAPVAE
ncbi:hypothetical protein [Ferrimonas senticii]|uniref:hypothetical protein n=1 Tax=Ferrimonas senticii TaxID=394566 RepID=UPI0012EC9595|nr:hypothetical protein [Ferrimonas senticii]